MASPTPTELLDSLGQAVVATDLSGKIVFWNASAEQLYGWRKGEVLGQQSRELLSAPSALVQGDAILAALRAGESYAGEFPVRRRDGTVFPAWVTVSPLRDGQGKLVGAVGLASDLSASKGREATLLRQFRELEAIYQLAPVGLCIFDRELRFQRLNARLAAINGAAVEEHLGRTLTEVSPAIAKQVEPLLERVLESGQALEQVQLSGETAAQPGVTRSWLASYAPIKDEAGVVRYVNVVVEEITERARQRQRLEYLSTASQRLGTSLELEPTLKQVAELLVPEIADWCTVDLLEPDGSLRLAAIAHKDPEKVRWGLKLRQERPIDPEADEGVARVVRSGEPIFLPDIPDDLLRQAARSPEELALLRSIGYSSIIIAPLMVHGSAIGALTLVMTESSRHFSDEDLAFACELAQRAAAALDNARLYTRLEHLSQALERRVAERTREVTELAGELSLVEARERQRIAKMLHDDLQQELYAAQFALRSLRMRFAEVPGLLAELDTLNEQLKIALRSARNATVDLSPPGREHFPEALRWLVAYFAERHGLTVELTGAAEAEIEDGARRSLAVNLLRELLFNVVKHAGVAQATVTLAEREGELAVTVSDEGRGFDPADLARSRGTGFGLSGVHRRLQLVGGRLELTPAPGAGTRVTFVLPRRQR